MGFCKWEDFVPGCKEAVPELGTPSARLAKAQTSLWEAQGDSPALLQAMVLHNKQTKLIP